MSFFDTFIRLVWDALFLFDPNLVPGYWGG